MPKAKKKVTPKPKLPQMYVVDIWDRVYHNRTTISKDIDTFRGQLAYSESRDKVINLSPSDGACENVVQHPFTVDRISYNPSTTPKEWIVNIHKAVIGPRYIASEAIVFYETEHKLSDTVLIALGEGTGHQPRYPDVV